VTFRYRYFAGRLPSSAAGTYWPPGAVACWNYGNGSSTTLAAGGVSTILPAAASALS
jgi:hypothetical protein